MESLYREAILERYKSPRHRGEIESPTIRERDANPLCGDELTIDLLIDSEGRVVRCSHSGSGCAISQAAADLLCDHVEGMSVESVSRLSREEMLGILGIPLGPVRIKCGLLAYKIVKVAALTHLGRGEAGE